MKKGDKRMPELINIDSHTEEYSAGMWINKKSLYQVDIKINQLPHSATSYYNTISLLEDIITKSNGRLLLG